MPRKHLILALSVIVAATPASAVQTEPMRTDSMTMEAAPPGGPDTRYCMRIEAATGSRVEPIRCWTRVEWAELGVDVDRDWPREGVTTIG